MGLLKNIAKSAMTISLGAVMLITGCGASEYEDFKLGYAIDPDSQRNIEYFVGEEFTGGYNIVATAVKKSSGARVNVNDLLTFDASKVNKDVAGEYEVTYKLDNQNKDVLKVHYVTEMNIDYCIHARMRPIAEENYYNEYTQKTTTYEDTSYTYVEEQIVNKIDGDRNYEVYCKLVKTSKDNPENIDTFQLWWSGNLNQGGVYSAHSINSLSERPVYNFTNNIQNVSMSMEDNGFLGYSNGYFNTYQQFKIVPFMYEDDMQFTNNSQTGTQFWGTLTKQGNNSYRLVNDYWDMKDVYGNVTRAYSLAFTDGVLSEYYGVAYNTASTAFAIPAYPAV